MKRIFSILLWIAALGPVLGANRPASTTPPAATAFPAPLNLLPVETLFFTNQISPAPDGDRFLFVVDHSSSMKKLAPIAHDAVLRMIHGGFNDRMTNGDSYGIWVVSAKPQIGVFPMQVWDGAHPLELASVAGHYLHNVPVDGRANFADLLTMLHSVVTAVGDLNILIFTDGETLFKGSPADDAVNQQLKTKGKEARRAGKPVVVALATREGRMAGFSVNALGETIQLPPRPPRIVVAKAPPPPVEKRANRSIIITNAPPKAAAVVAPPVPAPAPAIQPTPAPVVAPRAEIAPPPAPAGELPVEKAAAGEPGHTLAAHHAPLPPAPVPVAKPEPPTPAPIKTNAPESAPEAPEMNPPTLEKIPALEPLQPPATYRAETKPAAEAARQPSNAEPTRFASLLEKKMLVFARESGSNHPASALPTPAAAVPTTSWDAPVLVILGGALLLTALVLLWVVLRHQRRAADASLISRSMDRR